MEMGRKKVATDARKKKQNTRSTIIFFLKSHFRNDAIDPRKRLWYSKTVFFIFLFGGSLPRCFQNIHIVIRVVGMTSANIIGILSIYATRKTPRKIPESWPTFVTVSINPKSADTCRPD